MARRRGGRESSPTARDTTTLRQRDDSMPRPMVDGGRALAHRRTFGTPPEAVVVSHAGAPPFVMHHRDAVLLTLWPGDVPGALSWPSLAGLLVDAVIAGMLARAARSLVLVLLHAGAETVRVFDVVGDELVCIDTPAGVVL